MNKMLSTVARAYAHGLFIQGRRLSNQAKNRKGLKRQEMRVEQDNLARQTRIALLANAFIRKIPYTKLEKKTIDNPKMIAKKVCQLLEVLSMLAHHYPVSLVKPSSGTLESNVLNWMGA